MTHIRRRRIPRLLARTLTLASVVACGAGGAGSVGAGNSSSPTPTRSSASFLLSEDLRKTDALNLGDAIKRLRPQWLRRSNATQANTTGLSTSPAEPFVVWIDQSRAGGIEVLDQVPLTSVRSVQYFSPSEAQARFGTGYSSGAIQVITTASPKP